MILAMWFLIMDTNGGGQKCKIWSPKTITLRSTCQDQDLMPMKNQVYFGRCKPPGYKNI